MTKRAAAATSDVTAIPMIAEVGHPVRLPFGVVVVVSVIVFVMVAVSTTVIVGATVDIEASLL
jgi:hypothetical protein